MDLSTLVTTLRAAIPKEQKYIDALDAAFELVNPDRHRARSSHVGGAPVKKPHKTTDRKAKK